MSLRNYLDRFLREIAKLEDYGYSECLEIKEEIRANKLAVITAHIVLINGSNLHIKEYIDARYKIKVPFLRCHKIYRGLKKWLFLNKL
jgi:hypothetical protein